MRIRSRLVLALVVCLPAAADAAAQSANLEATVAKQKLISDSGGALRLDTHPATGRVRFLRTAPGSLPLPDGSVAEKSAEFFREYGAAFGVADAEQELRPLAEARDPLGFSRLSFEQRYRGLPVFAGIVRTHFDPRGRLVAVNGTWIPDLQLSTTPLWTRAEAESVARQDVVAGSSRPIETPLEIAETTLMIFRSGLIQRVPGRDHLAYRIEVRSGDGLREFVFVDAHSGKVVDRISGSHSAIHRTLHEPDFNSVVIWNEGDSLPYSTGDATNDGQVNDLITMADAVYDFYLNLSGGTFPSWDGVDGVMHTVWNASFVDCPNATWNGSSTNYCDGVASDDVIAHEWTHAYTESNHGLIYQWQPGALNEAYSDIFGEILDKLDNIGTDSPVPARTVGDCSIFAGDVPPSLTVLAPASLAGEIAVAGAGFNPPPPLSVSGDVELADDGAGGSDGCASLVGFTPGRIALIDRGSCSFSDKVINAQSAGAIGVLIVNSSNSVFSMGGSNGAITIPSVMVSSNDGNLVKAELGIGAQVAIDLPLAEAESLRWLIGEDSTAFGGAIRDMWNPTCAGDPDRVLSPLYFCAAGDSGGVHINSGVPNHAFALLTDGGLFNGHDVTAIGWLKAVHIYWRAMNTYQVPDSDFADHATALLQSCSDLLGVNLIDPSTGGPSGQTIGAADCAALSEALLAVEMSSEPACNFQPLLAPDPPPPACGAVRLFEDFESPTPLWSLANAGVFAEYSPRDWVRTGAVPEGGDGFAYFAIDSLSIGNCIEGDDDQSGAMTLDTPPIDLAGVPALFFDHYVATEGGFDGGNLKISVNGGPFQIVTGADFDFNPYNRTLETDGNTNPLAGQEAFSGADGGVVASTWGQSHVSLAGYAGPADSIRLRFDFGVDGCNGLEGWYVDNVLVCTDEEGAGSVPSGAAGSTAVTLARRLDGDIDLAWGASCASGDSDYEIYEGVLGDFTSHAALACSTGGQTLAQVSPGTGNRYYLVVPRSASREGSYGTDSAGSSRPSSAVACLPAALSYECF